MASFPTASRSIGASPASERRSRSSGEGGFLCRQGMLRARVGKRRSAVVQDTTGRRYATILPRARVLQRQPGQIAECGKVGRAGSVAGTVNPAGLPRTMGGNPSDAQESCRNEETLHQDCVFLPGQPRCGRLIGASIWIRQQTRLSGASCSEAGWGHRPDAVLADAIFCMLFHVCQYAVVDAVNEEIRPQCPVGMGKQFELIPGPTDQTGSAIR